MASGSFGPTTAGRMDSYVGDFQAAGGSFVMLAKGNRSRQVTDACKTYGGFYLGSIGGPAARLAQDCITKVEVLEYPELGMEAVWKIEVAGLPRVHRRRRQGQRLLRPRRPPLLRDAGRRAHRSCVDGVNWSAGTTSLRRWDEITPRRQRRGRRGAARVRSASSGLPGNTGVEVGDADRRERGELVADLGLGADDGEVLRAADALAVHHRLVARQRVVDGEDLLRTRSGGVDDRR